MPNRDVIVAGASAGGIEALTTVLSQLPGDLDAAVLVVVHMPAKGGPALRHILERACRLPVDLAADNQLLRSGRVYVSVGDFHLLVGPGRVYVRQGPRENGYRPAIDPLFRSAAAYYGPRVIGVVLSGNLSDGTAGLLAIRRQGGLAVVQDPADALYDSMPTSAIEEAGADHVVPADRMGGLLARLVSEEIEVSDPAPDRVLTTEVRLMEDGDLGEVHPGRPSPWPCPDCQGVLWEVEDGPVLRFRCRVGHAWSAESLLAQQADGVEGALWMALRALEDRAALTRRMVERSESNGRPLSAARYRDELRRMSQGIAIMRRLLTTAPEGVDGPGVGPAGPDGQLEKESGTGA